MDSIKPFLILWLISNLGAARAALWPPNYSDGSGRANLIPASMSLGYVCRVYCRYPMELGNVPCSLNASRLSSDPVTSVNKDLPLFNPYCWCIPFIMEYTPRCIWCLKFNNLVPEAAVRLSNAYELCLAPPISNVPCPGDCGNVTAYIQGVILPCEEAAINLDQKKACRCRQTAKELFETCQFCLLGWNKTEALLVGNALEVCNGTFSEDESTTSLANEIPTSKVYDATVLDPSSTSEAPKPSRNKMSPLGYQYAEWSFLPKFATLSEGDPLLLPLISTPIPISQSLGSLTETTTMVHTWPYGPWNLLAPPGEISLPLSATQEPTAI